MLQTTGLPYTRSYRRPVFVKCRSLLWVALLTAALCLPYNSWAEDPPAAPATTENPDTQTSEESPPPAPPIPTRPRVDLNRDLLPSMDLSQSPPTDEEAVWITTSKEGETLMGLYRFEGTGFEYGGILIFPDQQTHPAWPEITEQIRKGLPDHGWSTLAIALPEMPITPIPERTLPVLKQIKAKPADAPSEEAPPPAPEETPPATEGATDTATENTPAPEANTPPTEEPLAASQSPDAPIPNDTETATDTPATENMASDGEENQETLANDAEDTAEKEPPEPYQTRLIRLGEAGLSYLEQQGSDRLLVLGVGTGATWAAYFVSQVQQRYDLRLVMINPVSPANTEMPQLMSLLTSIEDTTLDLYHGEIKHREQELADGPKHRYRLARHNRMNNYRQIRLPLYKSHRSQKEPWVVRQVRGVLNTYVVKAEKEQKSLKINPKSSGPKTSQPPGGPPATTNNKPGI